MRRVGASGRCNGPSSPVAARHYRQNFRAGKSLTLAGDLVDTCIRGGAARMHWVPMRSATNSNVPNLAAPASRRATANWPPPARPQQKQRPRVGHRAVHGPCWRGTPIPSTQFKLRPPLTIRPFSPYPEPPRKRKMSHNRAPFYVSSEGILNGLCPAGSYAVTKWRPLSPLPRFGRKPGAWEKCQRDRGRLDETKGARSLLGFFDRIDSPQTIPPRQIPPRPAGCEQIRRSAPP